MPVSAPFRFAEFAAVVGCGFYVGSRILYPEWYQPYRSLSDDEERAFDELGHEYDKFVGWDGRNDERWSNPVACDCGAPDATAVRMACELYVREFVCHGEGCALYGLPTASELDDDGKLVPLFLERFLALRDLPRGPIFEEAVEREHALRRAHDRWEAMVAEADRHEALLRQAQAAAPTQAEIRAAEDEAAAARAAGAENQRDLERHAAELHLANADIEARLAQVAQWRVDNPEPALPYDRNMFNYGRCVGSWMDPRCTCAPRVFSEAVRGCIPDCARSRAAAKEAKDARKRGRKRTRFRFIASIALGIRARFQHATATPAERAARWTFGRRLMADKGHREVHIARDLPLSVALSFAPTRADLEVQALSASKFMDERSNPPPVVAPLPGNAGWMQQVVNWVLPSFGRRLVPVQAAAGRS